MCEFSHFDQILLGLFDIFMHFIIVLSIIFDIFLFYLLSQILL